MPSRMDNAGLVELEARMRELDEWTRALEGEHDDLEELRLKVFPDGEDPLDDWNDYHRVRSEYDRRAAEEFDLGQ
ncbi:hypothetical protein C3B54_11634 [Pontimonas salivibrio]|uniref:Uncharacterized protein n=1 Tax=Pontimonas salivibrio TaxID=1159327 RepID=A0A2L2BPN1_9MICO|nr:hypothetical protein [Pontimonas salivibrio]AVG23619.1 hypothetical protein C3B54_11634 [Pontimonas salivibrio]